MSRESWDSFACGRGRQIQLSQLRSWADTPAAGPVQVLRAPKVLSRLGLSPGPRVGTVDSEVRHIQVTSWPRTQRSKGVHCLLQDTQAGTLVPLATELPSHTTGMSISARHTAQTSSNWPPWGCGFLPGKHLLATEPVDISPDGERR